jgi:hypothetical protein
MGGELARGTALGDGARRCSRSQVIINAVLSAISAAASAAAAVAVVCQFVGLETGPSARLDY